MDLNKLNIEYWKQDLKLLGKILCYT